MSVPEAQRMPLGHAGIAFICLLRADFNFNLE
jgi:hypothetical protein